MPVHLIDDPECRVWGALRRSSIMFNGQKIVVVMPAYNAARTLRRTHEEVMAQGIVDLVIVVDDASHDDTVAIARTLRAHPGGGPSSQSRLRRKSEDLLPRRPRGRRRHRGHDPSRLPIHAAALPAMVSMVASGLYPCVLASRILGGGAMRGGMPWWKYLANRLLTLGENILLSAKLSEYHTGYRAFSRGLLEQIPFEKNSDDFVFDNQMLAQIIWLGAAIGEVTCPAKYMPEASSINFERSVRYGIGCLATALRFRLARWGLAAPLI